MGAGREFPEDASVDGEGPPGDPDQARRSPPQYAHPSSARSHPRHAYRAGDPRDLRAAGAPARDRTDQMGAGGSLPQVSGSRRLQRSAPEGAVETRGAGADDRRGHAPFGGEAARARDQSGGDRPAETPRLDLSENGGSES